MRVSRAVLMLVSAALLAACSLLAADKTPPLPAGPLRGFVTDMATFNRFIDTHPGPEQFRAMYPDVLLVLPGQVSSKEYRLNNSRFFAVLDYQGYITSGKFY